MDSTDSQDTGHNGSRRSNKRPMKFMFIDSTTQGANAKPNKAVRSFVMHQARRQKPWSTRQKPPQTPNSKHGPESSPSETQGRSSRLLGPWREFDANPNVWNAQSLGSPVSSSISSRSGSQPCATPPSSHGSVCDVPQYTGDCGHTPQTHRALARRDGFALGVLDPFDCLPVRADPKTSVLIDHFVSIISPRLIPVDLHQSSKIATTEWLANSLQHATSAPFTYAVLTSSALHLQFLGAVGLEDVLYYKARAISEINTLLSDPKTSVDDNNIAAVFMLLCLEESQLAPGNKEHDDSEWSELQRSVHLNGLRTMIAQRGGLSALSSNRCLQVFLLMHSVAHSISTFQRPYTSFVDSSGAPQKYDMPSFRPRPSSARIMRLFRDLKLSPDLVDIISNVVVFVGDVSSWYEDGKCPLDPLELQKHASLLMYRLFDWHSREAEEEKRSAVDQSICLASLVFLVKASQPYDPSYRAMMLTTVKKLRASLTKGSIFRWAKSPDLLLWTLTMGALAAQGSTEFAFFSQYCSVAFADAGLDERTNADELLDRMKKCLWIPMLFDDEVKKLWVQMGLTTGEEADDEDEGVLSPEIREDDVVGLLTSNRFFSKTGK